MVRLVVNAACAALLAIAAGCTPAGNASFSRASLGTSASGTTYGQLAKPEGNGPFPAVVLMHTCGGVGRHVRTYWPNELTANGYVTLMVDSFGSRGLGPCPNALLRRGIVQFKDLSQDAFGALDYLASLPFVDKNRIAVVGYSLGGWVIKDGLVQFSPLRPPGAHTFRAAVSMYGPCGSFFREFTGKYPFELLDLLGEKDELIFGQCRTVSHPQHSVIVLPGAYHAWDQAVITTMRPDGGGNPMLYSEAATRKSREILLDYLAKNLREAR